MRLSLLLFSLLLLTTLSSGQTAPATLPARETLAHGAITFIPPSNSELIGKRNDDLSAGYSIAIDAGQIVITISPQTQPITNRMAPQFAQQIQQAIQNEADKGLIQTISPPKVEQDTRFFLRVRGQFRIGKQFNDRLQLFRVVGSSLVSVVVTSFHEDADVTSQIHEMGETVLLSMKQKPQTTSRPAGSNGN